jgi:hypothetical protein
LPLAFFALIASIVAASVLEFAGAKFSEQLGTMAAAISLFAASNSAQKADWEHFFRASSWVRWPPLLILAIIVLQLAPVWLPVAHPIWASVHDALDGMAFGYVTADVGSTLNALFLALTASALIVVTILVARDRSRAERLLFVLSGITTLSAMTLDLSRPSPALIGASPTGLATTGLATTLGGFGLVLNLAVMQWALERAETHHALSRSVAVGACGLLGALINAIALFSFSSANSGLAAGFAVVLFLLILLIRRLDLSAIAAAALSIATLAGAVIVLSFVLEKSSAPALLRLVSELPDAAKAPLERMLADTRWLGAGAGTLSALARIYQSDATEWAAPSAAIAIFIDTGWIGLVAALSASVALLLRLCFGSLNRGRDSFFAAASAGCVCFALVEAFAGPGLLQPAAILCFSAIVGLGLSQSVSQSSRPQN